MNEKIVATVYQGIDLVNRQRKGAPAVAKSLDTALYGSASDLDSLELVNLVVAVEEKVEEAFGEAITLADDRALSQEPSPFTTVSTLAAYIETLLGETKSVSG